MNKGQLKMFECSVDCEYKDYNNLIVIRQKENLKNKKNVYIQRNFFCSRKHFNEK